MRKQREMIDRNQNFLGGVPKEAAAAAPTPSPHHGVSNPRFPWLFFYRRFIYTHACTRRVQYSVLEKSWLIQSHFAGSRLLFPLALGMNKMWRGENFLSEVFMSLLKLRRYQHFHRSISPLSSSFQTFANIFLNITTKMDHY